MQRFSVLAASTALALSAFTSAAPASAEPADDSCPGKFQLVKLRRLERLGYTFSGSVDRNDNGLVCAKGDIGEEDITIIDDRG